jgi:hypothetical protein
MTHKGSRGEKRLPAAFIGAKGYAKYDQSPCALLASPL